MKKIFVMILSLVLILFYQNCGQKFETQNMSTIDAPSESNGGLGGNQPPPPNTGGNPPGGGNTGGGTGGLPPQASIPLAALKDYLPQIPNDKCVSQLKVVDPFLNLTLNKKTVCSSGCDYTDLVAAVNAAQPNDEILVEPKSYKGCLKVKASPITIRGNGGLFTLDDWSCESAIELHGAQAKLSNFRIFGQIRADMNTYGVTLGTEPRFVQIENAWFEHMSQGVRGGDAKLATLIVQDFKMKDIGYVYGNNHGTGNIGSNPFNLLVRRGVFSHHRANSWQVRTDSINFEFLCNVGLRINNETSILIHMGLNKTVRIVNNFLQSGPTDVNTFYQNPSPEPTQMIMEKNIFLIDTPRASILGGTLTTVLTMKDNLVISGRPWLRKSTELIDYTINTYFQDRAAAGFPAYPAPPVVWPVSKY